MRSIWWESTRSTRTARARCSRHSTGWPGSTRRVRLRSSARADGGRRCGRCRLTTIRSAASPACATCRLRCTPGSSSPRSRCCRGVPCRLLLADEVGLGKTIQAGMLLAALIRQGDAPRVLVLVPAGLREQWADELSRRCGLQSTVVDAHQLRTRVRELPRDENPWTLPPCRLPRSTT